MGSIGLEAGTWSDVATHGQFLIDLEFLTRYTRAICNSGGGRCIYYKEPRYLPEIASLFPWLHFYAYQHVPDPQDYDPTQPEITAPMTVEVRSY